MKLTMIFDTYNTFVNVNVQLLNNLMKIFSKSFIFNIVSFAV